jgi:hypothetical protein
MVYLPMCYLYGKKYHLDATKDPVLLSLRKELYVPPTALHSIAIASG